MNIKITLRKWSDCLTSVNGRIKSHAKCAAEQHLGKTMLIYNRGQRSCLCKEIWLDSPSSSSSSLLKVIAGFFDLRDLWGVTKSPQLETEDFVWPVSKTAHIIKQLHNQHIADGLSSGHWPLLDFGRPLAGKGVCMTVDPPSFWFSSSISGLSTFSKPRVWTAVRRFSNSSTWSWYTKLA